MFSDPEKNISQFNLKEGMSVADLGAGAGFYTLAAARVVGEGKVYAVEVQRDLVNKIKSEAEKLHLNNIEIIWGNIEKIGGSKLSENSVDAVIASNVLFQITNKDSFLKEIKRILNSNGRVLFIDWSDSFNGLGPPQSNIITKIQAKEIFEQKGFIFEKDIDAGPHHYGIILRKA